MPNALYRKMMRSRAVSVISLASLALALGGGLWAYFDLQGVIRSGGAPGGAPTPLILHWNDIQGITSVGGLSTVVFMAVFGVAMALLNFWVSLELDERDRFLGKFTAATTLVFAVLLFLAFAAIISVN